MTSEGAMTEIGDWWQRLRRKPPRQANQSPRGMIEVVIYSKPGCHLCEEAKEVLLKVQRQEPFALREVNLEEDAEARVAFEAEIPVVFIAGRKAFKYRVRERELLRRLRRERAAGRERRKTDLSSRGPGRE